jgi:ankyrin repeat protein
VFKLLLAAGGNVNIVTNTGDTPLRLASQNGFAEVVQLLKSAGAK